MMKFTNKCGIMASFQKRELCEAFFYKLAGKLSETYTLMTSCNQDFSRYLIPKGTENEVSYYSKPLFSFRISDHWNWYSNIKKCSDPDYVQCENIDAPISRHRTDDDKATKPRTLYCVGFFDNDHKYHTIYGEKYDRIDNIYDWVEREVDDVVDMLNWIFGSKREVNNEK